MLGPARPPTGQCLCSPAHSFSPPPRVCPAAVASELCRHSWSPEQWWGGRGAGVGCVGGYRMQDLALPALLWNWDPASQGDTGPHFFTSNLIPIYLPILILSRYQNCVCSHVIILNRHPVPVLEPETNGVSAQPHPWLRLVFLT